MVCWLPSIHLLSAVWAGAQTPELLDFEDRDVGMAIFDQYPGVTVLGGDSNPPLSVIHAPALGTVSGEHVLRRDNVGEFAGSVVPLSFTLPQRRVALSAGLVDGGIAGMYLELRGYDVARPSGAQFAQPIVRSPAVFVGASPTAIDVPLQIEREQGDILSAFVVVLSEPGGWSVDATDVAIDNLIYEAPDDLPPPDDVAPLIAFLEPMEGATVRGPAPGEVRLNLRGSVQEARGLRQLMVQLNGGLPQRISHGSSLDGTYRFLATLFDHDGLRQGSNDVLVHAEDFGGNVASASLSFDYDVVPLPAPSEVDIVPIGVELNQAISFGPLSVLRPEADGFSVEVPDYLTLVQGKDTLVRVYAVNQGTNASVDDVPASLVVFEDDCTGSCRLGALAPLDDATTTRSGIRVLPAGAEDATLEAMSRDLDATWNFLIPAAWTRRTLRLSIDVNVPAVGGAKPVPECKAEYLGECDRGNRITARATFREPHRATVSPILVTLGSEAASFADVASVLRNMNALYPTQFDLGPIRSLAVPADITGDDLLARVQDRFGCTPPHITDPGSWLACGFDPTTFQPAVVPRSPTGSAPGKAVLGNNAYYTIAGGTTPAHEAGHAIGFQHATCAHDEASGGACDEHFPTDHGRIAGIGFDLERWALKLEDIDASTHAHDVMSYGGNRWISSWMWNVTADHPYVSDVDYDWCLGWTGPYQCGLAQGDAARRGAPGPAQDVLWVQGRVELDGSATLLDAFGLQHTVPTAGARTHEPTLQLEALDALGNTLAAAPVALQEVQSDGPSPQLFRVAVAMTSDQQARTMMLQLRDPVEGVIGQLSARSDGSFEVDGVTVDGAAAPWARDEVRTVRWTVPASFDTTSQAALHAPGRSPVMLGSQLAGGTLEVSGSDLPAASAAQIVVRVSDGVHSRMAVSEPFAIAAAEPHLLLLEPAGPLTVQAGVPVSLWGVGSDDRGPVPDDALSWAADTVGALGTGPRAVAAELPAGTHVVTLSVAGSEASASVVITVLDDAEGRRGCRCDTATGGGGLGAGLVLLLLARLRRRGGGAVVLAAVGMSLGACGGPSTQPLLPDSPTTDLGQPATFSVGGTVSGLRADQLQLSFAGQVLTLTADGRFVFDAPVAAGTPLEVTVVAHPRCPDQICTVDGASGTVSEDVQWLQVVCREPRLTLLAAGALDPTLSLLPDAQLAGGGEVVHTAAAAKGPDDRAHGVAADPENGLIYVAMTGRIAVFDSDAAAGAIPLRTFRWLQAEGRDIDDVAYDRVRRRLYASIAQQVFAIGDPATRSGALAPDAGWDTPASDGTLTLAIDDQADVLYVSHHRPGSVEPSQATVHRYQEASRLDDPAVATTLWFEGSGILDVGVDLWVDACTDRMYALQTSGTGPRELMVLDGASSGWFGRVNILDDLSAYADFPGGVDLVGDGGGRLYLLDDHGNVVLVHGVDTWQGPSSLASASTLVDVFDVQQSILERVVH
ncbi:MAG: hypothetical protein KTR31_28115 [Myxococcales bacterium]|nr:hypothetical protein [Myxococcales bacterium]